VKETGEHPPLTHNLLMLSKSSGLELSELQVKQFSEINTFNIEARYPDEKFKFYKKCTRKFTEEHIKIIKEILKWLKKRL
jgi:HEPN domain-containing protein